ncbi:MAG: TonB-dependent receptor [Bryobacterales bacterium]|nr:TonB-dependent receptor [Bryobacterales bacterium]
MRSFALFSLSFFLLSRSAYSQSEIGGATLNGSVTDSSGAAVAGAKVTAQNRDTGLERSAVSSEAGLYNLVRMPVGRYDLTVEYQGFKTAKKPDVPLAVGAVLTIDVQLEVGASSESVTVTAETPVIESTRSQTSTAVNEKAVRDLPINGRNFLDFTVLTPGVVRDPRGGDLSFGGQRGTANSLLVDGGDSNNLFFGQSSGRAGTRNPYTFSQEAVQEFQVNTSGYNAETGRAGGGVINVVTKSGGNEFHGTGFWFFRDKGLNANTFFNNAAGRVKQPYHFNQFGGNVSGPAARNKLFFFYNYDGQRNTLPNPVFFPTNIAIPSDAASQAAAGELRAFLTPYTTGFDNSIHTVKMDWIASATDTFNVRYNYHRFNGKNFENAGAQSAAEHTGNSQNNTDNIAMQYTKVIGSNKVFDSRFIFLKDNAPGQANATSPEAQIRQSGATMVAIGRNNFSPRYTNTKKLNFIESLAWNSGKHALKAGADLNFERIDNFFPGNFGGSFVFDSLADWTNKRPSAFTQGLAGAGTDGPLTKPNVQEYAFFAQDTWRASEKLTFNFGVRYDLFSYAQPGVQNPNQQLLSAGLDTSKIHRDNNNLALRFGFARRMGDKMVLRGGYGVFYARTASILIGTAHSQNGIQVQTYTLSAANPAQAALIPRYPNVLSAPPALGRTPDIYVVAPDYVQPQSHQWSLNWETQLGRDYALTLGYLGVRGVHLSRTRDINHFPGADTPSTFSGGGSVVIQRRPNARPNTAFGRISLFDSGGDSVYHGGFAQVSKRFAQNFQLLTSYTWSKVIDTLPDQTSVVPGNAGDDAKVAFDTLNPNADRGPGDANIKHRWVLSGVWDVDYAKNLSSPVWRAVLRGYQISAISNVQSGRWFSARSNVDLNNDGNRFSDRSPGYGRNTIEGPGFAAVDFRVSRDVPIYRERAKLRLMFEAFNAFNRANFSALQLTPFNYNATTRVFTPVANFLAPSNTSDPRILQLAARFTF